MLKVKETSGDVESALNKFIGWGNNCIGGNALVYIEQQ
jgi:hypothetical protein